MQDGTILKVANKKEHKVNLLEKHFYYYPPKTLRNIFKHCEFRIIRTFNEDISRSLKDFGLLNASAKEEDKDEYNLQVYDKKPDNDFSLTIDEIDSLKIIPLQKAGKYCSINTGKKFLDSGFLLFDLPLGHQQHIYARKQ